MAGEWTPTISEWGGGRDAFARWREVMGGPAGYISRAADDVELPAGPKFRAALMDHAEWGSRLALQNSRPGAAVAEHAPVPRWGWGVAPPCQP